MATRFGAVSPAQTYATKVRWLIGCLVAVILVLVALLIVLGGTSPEPAPEQLASHSNIAPAHASQTHAEDVLVAVRRIEEGARIESFMAEPQKLPNQDIPQGAIRAHEASMIMGKQFSQRTIQVNQPITWDVVGFARPISALNIPPGFRAVSIHVDPRTAVEGWVVPDSRVDVLWTYTDRDNRKKVATIVRFTKILSVGGIRETAEGRSVVAGQTTATLLVAEEDAKKIELARTLGALTLSLVGDREQPQDYHSPQPTTIEDIIGRPKEQVEANKPVDGKMIMKDPKTGQMVSYVLSQGRWARESE